MNDPRFAAGYRVWTEVLFASQARCAVVLRRGPKRHAHLLTWSLEDDAFVRGQCRRLRAAFDFCDLFYSVKANYNPALLRIVAGEGLGVDAVSPGEVELALRCGVAPHAIVYVENNMSDAEMEFAVARGVRADLGDGLALATQGMSLRQIQEMVLTAREREIAALLMQGLTSKQIGRSLQISPRTVDVYRARLMRKYGAANISELVQKLLAG